LLAVQRQAPEGTKVAIFESIRDLPHFDPDLDGEDRDPEDRPVGVLRLRRELAASDAMLISTPEYAHGLPGALNAQEQLREILTTMSALVVRDAIVAVQGVRSKVDDSGTVLDPQLALQVQNALKALDAFVQRAEIGERGV
jgi:NAD(P)H-dependent FMN reductase